MPWLQTQINPIYRNNVQYCVCCSWKIRHTEQKWKKKKKKEIIINFHFSFYSLFDLSDCYVYWNLHINNNFFSAFLFSWNFGSEENMHDGLLLFFFFALLSVIYLRRHFNFSWIVLGMASLFAIWANEAQAQYIKSMSWTDDWKTSAFNVSQNE